MSRLIAADRAETIWRPLIDESDPDTPTPQRQAYDSQADELFYGGAAGGGKTDLICGLALTAHRRSIVFRRESVQLQGVIQRLTEIIGTTTGYNSQDKIWRRPDGRIIELGHCQHAGDELKYQGRAHDLKAFDEITHFLPLQYRFLSGWLRSTIEGQRQRIVCTGNPPTDSDGDWVRVHWSPWLDDQHPSPAQWGALRWFATLDGEDTEVESGARFEYKGDVIVPRSRSFIASRVEDNPYLLKTGYRATLQSLPEPLRSQLLRGDFEAGREDNPWQVIPTAWVDQAMERWTAGKRPKVPMSAIGCDPARGGRDETIVVPRWGAWVGELVIRPGSETPDGPSVAGLVVSTARDGAQINVDAIGVGTAVVDALRQMGVNVKSLVSSVASHGRDRSGSLGFTNLRSEWWWRAREALDPDYGEEIALPPDSKLRADLCAPRWDVVSGRIKIESKDDIYDRIQRSTDRGDAVVYALAYDTLPHQRPGRAGRRMAAAQSAYDPHAW